jgi:hypothetical protein
MARDEPGPLRGGQGRLPRAEHEVGGSGSQAVAAVGLEPHACRLIEPVEQFAEFHLQSGGDRGE